MKKNILVTTLLVMILITGFVSAGGFSDWWIDFWRNAPSPEDSQEGDVQFSPDNLDLDDLEEGIKLEKRWNYWYTWDDKNVSIKDAVEGLENLRYILAYDSNWKHQGYWHPDGKQPYSGFQKGWKYALNLKEAEEWRYSESLVIERDIGDMKYIETNFQKDCEIFERYFDESECEGTWWAEYSAEGVDGINALVERHYSDLDQDQIAKYLSKMVSHEKFQYSSLEEWGKDWYYVIYGESENGLMSGLVTWISNKDIVFITLSNYDEEVLNEDVSIEAIMTAYFEKYPSDLSANSPVPEISSDDSSSGGSGGSSSSGNGVTVYTKSEVDSMMNQSSGSAVTCIKEGGFDPYKKGRILTGKYPNGEIVEYDQNSQLWDVCARDNNAHFENNSNALMEGYCGVDGTIQSTDRDNVYICPNGCEDGACI